MKKVCSRRKPKIPWLRWLGILILILLVVRADPAQILNTMAQANLAWMAIASMIILPLIAVKSLRWQIILRSQGIEFRLWPAYLAYFASMLVGFVTPGRLGEFVKALYIQQDCRVSAGKAFSGVLVDRLFDLYILFAVSFAALFSLNQNLTQVGVLVLGGVFSFLPLLILLNRHTFNALTRITGVILPPAAKLLAPGGWIAEMRLGLNQINPFTLLKAVLLTSLAYGVYFGQCYLVAMALRLPVGFLTITFTVALGSLVTLIPISISGLGTREAAVVAYLGAWGILPETALSFSLLIFAVSYISAAVFGLIAWWLKPLPWNSLKSSLNEA